MFKVWELINGVINDERVGNFWTVREAETLYILRKLEIFYKEEYGWDMNLTHYNVEPLPQNSEGGGV